MVFRCIELRRRNKETTVYAYNKRAEIIWTQVCQALLDPATAYPVHDNDESFSKPQMNTKSFDI